MEIIVFGTSIAQGFDDTEKGGWVNRLYLEYGPRKSGQAHDDYHAVFNLGVSGDNSDGLVKRVASELAFRAGKENLIIFETGGNDSVRNLERDECEVPIEKFAKNCQQLLAVAQTYGQVVFLGLYDSDESQLNPISWHKGHAALDEDGEKYDLVLKDLCENSDAHYIPMKGLFEKDFTAFTYDGDHPSAEGHRLIFERVKNTLEKEGIL